MSYHHIHHYCFVATGEWEKLAPEVQRKSRGTATEDANKIMVLEGHDGFFSHVASMVDRGNNFMCHVGVADGLLIHH
jgi:hypothetical protein